MGWHNSNLGYIEEWVNKLKLEDGYLETTQLEEKSTERFKVQQHSLRKKYQMLYLFFFWGSGGDKK